MSVIQQHKTGYCLTEIKKMGKGILTIILLIVSNAFMTLAWYGHLKFGTDKMLPKWGLLGSNLHGGPFSLIQLKVIQEVITLLIFVAFSAIFFKTESFRMNHLIAFIFLVLAVYFVFKN